MYAITSITWHACYDFYYLTCMHAMTSITWHVCNDFYYLTCMLWLLLPDMYAMTSITWHVCYDFYYLTCMQWLQLPDMYAMTSITWHACYDFYYLTCMQWLLLPDMYAITSITWHVSMTSITWHVCNDFYYLTYMQWLILSCLFLLLQHETLAKTEKVSGVLCSCIRIFICNWSAVLFYPKIHVYVECCASEILVYLGCCASEILVYHTHGAHVSVHQRYLCIAHMVHMSLLAECCQLLSFLLMFVRSGAHIPSVWFCIPSWIIHSGNIETLVKEKHCKKYEAGNIVLCSIPV